VQALVVVLIAAALWTFVFVAVVAFCKAAQAGDRTEAGGWRLTYDRHATGTVRRRRRSPALPSRRSGARIRSHMRWSS
jgi:hypothetical protein